MKKKVFVISALLLAVLALFAACSKTVTITEFEVEENRTRYVSLGDSFRVPRVLAKDSGGGVHEANAAVTDPNGKAVSVDEESSFTADVLGEYRIAYTVTVAGKTETKGFKLLCEDLDDPVITSAMPEFSLATLGYELEIPVFTVEDNSGEEITPSVEVVFGDEKKSVNDKVLLDREGTYEIRVTAQDSTGNSVTKSHYIFTKITFEDGIYPGTEWYPATVNEQHAYSGTKSYEFGAFAAHHNYFAGGGYIFGDIALFGDADLFSYWMYSDMKAAGFNGEINIYTDTASHVSEVYDRQGNKMTPKADWENKMCVTISCNEWYRVVVSIKQPVGDATNLTNLADYMPTYTAWDTGADAAPAVPHNLYYDDLRILKSGEAPTIDNLPIKTNTLCAKGETLDVSGITATDEDGTELAVTTKLTFNGDTEVAANGGIYTLDGDGSYTLYVYARDAHYRTTELYIDIYTLMNAEKGDTIGNRYFDAGNIKTDKARDGERVYSLDLFKYDTHNWTDQNQSIFGDVLLSGESDTLTFWMYYDTAAVEDYSTAFYVNQINYEFKMFVKNDEGTEEVYAHNQTLEGWMANRWMRVEVKRTSIDGLSKLTNLNDLKLFFGTWSDPSKPFPVYIDSISI